MVLEMLGQFGYLGVAFFALLYSYSGLPKLDWGHITAGALLMFSASALTALTTSLAAWWAGATVLNQLSALLTLVGALLVLVGAVKNALAHVKG
jgi:hypothetical protein